VILTLGWRGSRVVSVLDSGTEGPGFKSQPRRCRVCLGQTVHTHRASVYQAAKLPAALLRVARVTAGLAESNGSLPPGLWLTSPAGWLPKTRISSETLCSVLKMTLKYRENYCSSYSIVSLYNATLHLSRFQLLAQEILQPSFAWDAIRFCSLNYAIEGWVRSLPIPW